MSLGDLVIYGIILIQPVAALPLFGHANNLSKGHAVTAILVAIGRGGQVDESALIEALTENKIGGAVLDVFTEEPLPADSPLWETPNLFITPHIAGSTKRYPELVQALFSANLQRYLNGKELYN